MASVKTSSPLKARAPAVKKTRKSDGVTATKTTKTRKKATPRKSPGSTLASREDQFKKIQEEAYYLAEQNGFTGDQKKYWLAAERNVLKETHNTHSQGLS